MSLGSYRDIEQRRKSYATLEQLQRQRAKGERQGTHEELLYREQRRKD